MDSLGSSETIVIRQPISWTNSMARWFHAPAVSIATVKKDVGFCQFSIFDNFVDCCFVSCCGWLYCSVTNVWISERVWHCHIPSQWFAFGPRQQSGAIWAFPASYTEVDWLFHCQYLCSLYRSPYDVIQVAMTLLSCLIIIINLGEFLNKFQTIKTT